MGAKKSEFRELITAMFREQHKHPHLTVNLLRQHWAEILGQELADKTYPARIAGHTLWINALDASWAYQLQFMKHEMLESVQVFMGAVDITELRFKQGGLHSTSAQDAERTVEAAPAEPGAVLRGEQTPASADGKAPGALHSSGAGAIDGTSVDTASTDSEEETHQAATTIADDSLRNSFSRWARVKKRTSGFGD